MRKFFIGFAACCVALLVSCQSERKRVEEEIKTLETDMEPLRKKLDSVHKRDIETIPLQSAYSIAELRKKYKALQNPAFDSLGAIIEPKVRTRDSLRRYLSTLPPD